MVIKVNLELVGDKFKYEYEVAGERQAGEMPFGEDHLQLVANVIRASKSIRAFKKNIEVYTHCPILNEQCKMPAVKES